MNAGSNPIEMDDLFQNEEKKMKPFKGREGGGGGGGKGGLNYALIYHLLG